MTRARGSLNGDQERLNVVVRGSRRSEAKKEAHQIARRCESESEVVRTGTLFSEEIVGVDELAQSQRQASTADASAEPVP
jgi:hypothetical protein